MFIFFLQSLRARCNASPNITILKHLNEANPNNSLKANRIKRLALLSKFYGNTLEILILSLLTKDYLLLLRKKKTSSIFNITK